jgi:hypothetical protein
MRALYGMKCVLRIKLYGNFIKKCRDFLGRDILGTTFFRADSSLIPSSCRSFIRVIVPYEISKVNFRVETKILKVIMKSRTLSRTCDTTETRNPRVIKVILLACFTYIDIF